DENKPTGSIKIRVETIGYFLKRYREDMVRNRQKQLSVDEQLRKFEEQLRAELATAEKYRGSEAPMPASQIVQISNAPAESHEMVAGD
ncbi:MAG TPA: hypothetical protein VE825_13990, partial [Terriglobales bacterium]|nr:hypothetical protein [Terriglobales bacterium]